MVKLHKYLCDKNEYVISKQILRSGTSIGANVAEGRYAQSKADFINKMNIALKEAAETEYWLDLLKETGYMSEEHFININNDCSELIKILISIVKSGKNNP